MKLTGNDLGFKTKIIRQSEVSDETVFIIQFQTDANEKNAKELSKLFNQPLNVSIEPAQAKIL